MEKIIEYITENKTKAVVFGSLSVFLLLAVQVYQVIQLSIDHEDMIISNWSRGDEVRTNMVKSFQKDCVEWIGEQAEKDFEESLKKHYSSFECARDKGLGELIDIKESISYESIEIPFPLSVLGREFLFD